MRDGTLIPMREAALKYIKTRTEDISHQDRIKRAINESVELCAELYPGTDIITDGMLEVIEQRRKHAGSFTEDRRICLEVRRFADWIKHGYGKIKVKHRTFLTVPWEKRLRSSMAKLIVEFVRRKKLAGFIYKEEQHTLLMFDAMMADEFPDYTTVTREIALRWVNKVMSGGVTVNTGIRLTTPVRQFCKYVKKHINPTCYVIPEGLPGRYRPYQGHLITEKELKAFFVTADSVSYKKRCPFRHLTLPVAFRLMYACGLRVSEIRSLRRDDVDLASGVIKIRESKAHALRLVVMHPDMLEVMCRYDSKVKKDLPGRIWFFADRADGSQMNHCKIGMWFRFIWSNMHCDEKNIGPQATARDFRHLYALTVINRWHRSGNAPEALEPWLACYMGHSDFAMTCYYIHLENSFSSDFAKLSAAASDDVFDDIKPRFSEEVPYDI